MLNTSKYTNPTLNYKNNLEYYEWGINTLDFLHEHKNVKDALHLIKEKYPNCKIMAQRMKPGETNLFVIVYYKALEDIDDADELKYIVQPIFPNILDDDEDYPSLPLTVLPALSPTLRDLLDLTEEV